MPDFQTILDPRKLDWIEGEGENVAQLMAGGPATSMDRAAIGEANAQDIFNCSVDKGAWELDDRYRQFSPSPITLTDVLLSNASATHISTNCLSGVTISQAFVGAP